MVFCACSKVLHLYHGISCPNTAVKIVLSPPSFFSSAVQLLFGNFLIPLGMFWRSRSNYEAETHSSDHFFSKKGRKKKKSRKSFTITNFSHKHVNTHAQAAAQCWQSISRFSKPRKDDISSKRGMKKCPNFSQRQQKSKASPISCSG